MAGDDDILDSSDGLNDAERAEFAQMQEATSGGQPPLDPGAGAAADAAAGAADGAADAAAGAVDAGAKDGAAAAGAADAKDGAAGTKEGAAAAADAGAADGVEDDDDDADEPVLGADGKPALAADGKPRRKSRVSANKYNAEKTRADKLDTDLRATREQMARADERMRLINEALTSPRVDPNAKKPGDEEDVKPDPEADAFGYMKWSDAKIAKLEKAITDMQQGKQTEDGQKVVADAYTADATQYAAQEPNFVPAYNHLMASRTQELAMYFFGVDLTDQNARKLTPNEIGRIKSVASEEERGIVENAIAQGRSPAQAVYQMSRFRGYQPQTKEQFEAAAAARRAAANGGAPGKPGAKAAANGKPANGAAENGGKAGNVAEEIERIKAGSEAALSLSDGGASPANPLTAQRLADMPEEQFNALMDRLDGSDPEAFRRIVEGAP